MGVYRSKPYRYGIDIDNKNYTIKTNDSSMVPTWKWNGNVGTVNLRPKSEVQS